LTKRCDQYGCSHKARIRRNRDKEECLGQKRGTMFSFLKKKKKKKTCRLSKMVTGIGARGVGQTSERIAIHNVWGMARGAGMSPVVGVGGEDARTGRRDRK
jgi:hypothetical protein